MVTNIHVPESGPPRGRITRRVSIKLTIEDLPSLLLERPSDDAIWTGFVIPIGHFELFRQIFEKLPCMHAVGITSDGKQYQVAMTGYCFQYLKNPGIGFQVLPEPDLQTQEECSAEYSYVQKATEAILSGRHGRGLDLYFCGQLVNTTCMTAIQWVCFQANIESASSDLLRQFLQYYVFILLHAAKEPQSLDCLDWNKDKWLSFFTELCITKSRIMRNGTTEMAQQPLLLQTLFEAAAKRRLYPRTFDPKLSAEDNIKIFGSLLLHDDKLTAVPLGSINETIMQQCLSKCNMFEGRVQFQEIENQICSFVPIWCPKLKGLPAHACFSLQQGDIVGILHEMTPIYNAKLPPGMPDYNMDMSEHETFAFLCASIYLPPADDTLHEWAASSESDNFFWETLNGFKEQETKEQTCRRVLALVGYGKLQPCSSDMDSQPINGCYLQDFIRLLKGEKLPNTQAVLQDMAASYSRAIGGCHHDTFGSYFQIVEAKIPEDVCSEEYWKRRALDGCDHTSALELVLQHVKEHIAH